MSGLSWEATRVAQFELRLSVVNSNVGATLKAKKAIKRLTKVEANVLAQYSGNEQDLPELLNSARASVGRAKEAIDVHLTPAAIKKLVVWAEAPQQRRLTAAQKKDLVRRQAADCFSVRAKITYPI